MQSKFVKKNDSDQIWWLVNPDKIGEFVFSFDKETLFNMFADYPHKLTLEQRRIFDKENPYWANFFSDRRSKAKTDTDGVECYKERRQARLDARKLRCDDEEESNNNGGSGGAHGNTRLPYGIAKGKGIDTEGMTPAEVWKALEGEGVSAKEEYAKLGKKGKEPETITRAIHSGGGVSKFQRFKNPYVTDEERATAKKNILTNVSTGRSWKGWMHPKAFDQAGTYVRDEVMDRFKRRKKNKDLDEYIDKPQIEDIYDVLRDVRPFGAPKSFKDKYTVSSELSDERTQQILDDAFSRFPSEWFEDCSKNLKIHIINHEGRAVYNHWHDDDGVIYIYAKESSALRKELPDIPEYKCDAAIANELAHEMGHYVEDANETVRYMCRETLASRTKKSEEEYLEAGFTTKKDSFFDPYMGKQYAWGDTEILSVLMQHLGYSNPMDDIRGVGVFSSKPTDKDSLKFILGMLAGL